LFDKYRAILVLHEKYAIYFSNCVFYEKRKTELLLCRRGYLLRFN